MSESSKDKIQWHSGCYAGLMQEFQDETGISVEREAAVITLPRRIDFLVKKTSADRIKNEIGQIFRMYNILEYKGPQSSLDIEDYFQLLMYVYAFIRGSTKEEPHPYDQCTATLIHHSYPRSLIKQLKKHGLKVEKRKEGIYDVVGSTFFPVQLIVLCQLDARKHKYLRILTPKAKKADLKQFLEQGRNLKDEAEIERWQELLNIILQANKKKIIELQEEEGMVSPIIREFMRDELEQSRQEGIRIGKETGEKIGQEIGQEIGQKIGQKVGEKIGELKAKKQMALNFWHMGFAMKEISQGTGVDEKQIEEWLKEEQLH